MTESDRNRSEARPADERPGDGGPFAACLAHHYGDLTDNEAAALEAELARSAGARSELAAVRGLAAALDLVPVPDPDPARWSLLAERVAERLALGEDGPCAEWEPRLAEAASGSPEAAASGELAAHLESCAGCRRALEDFAAVSDAMDLASVPRPSAARWSGLKGRVLAEVAAPAAPLRLATRRRWASGLLRLAAAVALIACGAALAQLWPRAPMTARSLEALRGRAERALEDGLLARAEDDLARLVVEGTRRGDRAAVVAEAHDELAALRAYRGLLREPRERREPALARFILGHPAARVTRRALGSYARLRARRAVATEGGHELDKIDPIPAPQPGVAHRIPRLATHGEVVAMTRGGEPWLRDAARLQLAALALRTGRRDEASEILESLEGASAEAVIARGKLRRLLDAAR